MSFGWRGHRPLSHGDWVSKPGVADVGGYPGVIEHGFATPTALWRRDPGESRNHPVRNLVELGYISGGITRGSSFLATPGFVTGVLLGHGSARRLWIMCGIDSRYKARAALAAAEEAA